jgi:GT2 family glycosyltransferase
LENQKKWVRVEKMVLKRDISLIRPLKLTKDLATELLYDTPKKSVQEIILHYQRYKEVKEHNKKQLITKNIKFVDLPKEKFGNQIPKLIRKVDRECKNAKISFEKKENPKVSIIILNWNGLDYLKKCLYSIKQNTIFEDYEVIVVDNGSTDGSLDYLNSIKGIKVVKNRENKGFVKGNNQGIDLTTDSDVVLLNNDIIVPEKDWLTKLKETADKNKKTGIVGCRMLNGEGKLLHAGTIIHTHDFWGQQIGSNQEDINQYSIDREVQGIVFACAYIKRKVIEKVGLLDTDFFSYFEDTSYCFKAREMGFKTVCCGGVTLIHYENVSTQINKVSFSDIFETSQKTFKKKWKKKLENRFKDKVSFHSISNFPTGYAMSCRNFMLQLYKKNIDVRYKYVYGAGTPFPVEEPQMSDNHTINVIRARKFRKGGIQIVYGQGDVFFKNTGDYKIGYTMLEVTGVPKEWVRQANMMDEIWVPSTFNVKTFKKSGVKVPIKVIPLGFDPDFFNPNIKLILNPIRKMASMYFCQYLSGEKERTLKS